MKAIWIFYYEDSNGENIVTGIKECIRPERTKRYKKNLQRLNDNKTNCVGYKRILTK